MGQEVDKSVYNPVVKAVEDIFDKKLWIYVDSSRNLSTELSTAKVQCYQVFHELIHNFTVPTTTTIIILIYYLIRSRRK